MTGRLRSLLYRQPVTLVWVALGATTTAWLFGRSAGWL